MKPVVLFFGLLVGAGAAQALDSHAKPVVKPIYKTENGVKRVIGAKITTILKSDGGTEPRLHLGSLVLPAHSVAGSRWNDTEMRHFGVGRKAGYMRKEWRGVNFRQNGLEEVTVDVIYG